MSDNFNKFVQKLQCQFLSCYPVHHMDWKEISKNLTVKNQPEIIKNTFLHPLNEEAPIKNDYQIYFLKKALELMEENNEHIQDEFYEHICRLQGRPRSNYPEMFAYKHYVLPTYSTYLTLSESNSFVSAGNTGLCTWQACLALTDYLLHNPHIVRNKCVVELGAGTGLCGLVVMQCLEPWCVFLTDGSQECVDLMRRNLVYNFKNADEESDGIFKINDRYLYTHQLIWDEVDTTEWTRNLKADIILAADVIYDESVFSDLTKAIEYLFNLSNNNTKMYLAATVRNKTTLYIFTALLASLNFETERINVIPSDKSYLYWPRATPVTILLITRKAERDG